MIDFRLYLITDRERIKIPLYDAIKQSLEAGAKAIQLREKSLSTRELLKLAYDIRKLTYQYGAKLFINDRVDIALVVGANGVHLGIKSMPPDAVKRITSKDSLIGFSAHGIEEAKEAQEKGADFITFSPIYETKSKIGVPPKGLKELQKVSEKISIPVFALGGINADKVNEVLCAGAYGVAIVSAIFCAEDIKKETEKIVRLLK